MTWEGLNAPVQMTKEWEQSADREREGTRDRDKFERQRGEGRPGQRPFQRGWSGTSWPGRKIGPPESPDGG